MAYKWQEKELKRIQELSNRKLLAEAAESTVDENWIRDLWIKDQLQSELEKRLSNIGFFNDEKQGD